MWQKKRDFKRPACIKNYKGPNSIKPCYRRIYHKRIKLSKCYLLPFEFLLVILGGFSEAKACQICKYVNVSL